MRLPAFRRTLIELVIAATPLAGSGGCFLIDDDCSRYIERHDRVAEPPTMELEMLVRACEADATTCIELCNAVLHKTDGYAGASSCEVTHDATGHDLTIGYYVATGASGCPVEGRRPPGLARARRPCASRTATHLARSAWFEAASVHAFIGLARDLERHGAPMHLVRATQRAAAQEVEHARIMGELALARGATAPAVKVAPPRRRSIETIAIENATEGLVGETWAALVAIWQARHAADATLRDAYARIAEDEMGHADLARQVHDWAVTRLSRSACRRVDTARDRAVARLGHGVKTAAPAEIVEELGMPDGPAMQRLFAEARTKLWSASPANVSLAAPRRRFVPRSPDAPGGGSASGNERLRGARRDRCRERDQQRIRVARGSRRAFRRRGEPSAAVHPGDRPGACGPVGLDRHPGSRHRGRAPAVGQPHRRSRRNRRSRDRRASRAHVPRRPSRAVRTGRGDP